MEDKQARSQPDYNIPLPLDLTPTEIMALAPSYHTGCTSYETLLGLSDIHLEFKNARTGFACRLATYEGPGEVNAEIEEWEAEVELETNAGFIMVRWICRADDRAQIADLRKLAEQTVMAWSGIIGVRVGYGLAANPPEY